MRNEQIHNKTTSLLTLAVFGVFALCLAAVLLMGAGTYRNLVQQGEEAHRYRIAARYVTTRFHLGMEIKIEDFYGLQAMTVREELGGRTYLTRVYCHEGSIRELFSGEQAAVSPGDGEIVLEAESLTFQQEENLLRVCILHTDGHEQQLLLNMAGGRGSP